MGRRFTTCAPHRSQPGQVALTSFSDRRDRQRFAAAYADPESGITTGPRAANWPVCVGPITYTGHDAIAARHRQLQSGAAGQRSGGRLHDRDRAGSASRIANRYYKTEEEFMFACAERLARGIQGDHRRGACILQLDDPSIAENWDQINPEPQRRGVQEIHHAAGRGAEPRDQGPAAGSHPLPSLLGQLARPAHHRHSDARHRRRDAGDQCGGLFIRSRQCAPRARVDAYGRM